MNKIIVYVSGKDRIGIISDISKAISNLNGNIETSKMIKSYDKFNMLLLVSINSKRVNELRNNFKIYSDLNVLIDDINVSENETLDKYIFILKGANTEGIVHQYTNLFSKNRVNIIDMNTKIVNAPVTGSPLFYVKAVILIPENFKISMIADEIKKMENELNVKIKFEKFTSDFNH